MPKALILRTCDKDLKSHGGFQWPESGWAEAPDWKPTRECGNGLHGLLWGVGDADLLAHGDSTSKWMVAEIDTEEMADLEGKVKVRRANVVHVGTRESATAYLYANGAQGYAVVFGTATAGYSGTATAGDRGTATAGDRGTATAGDRGTATAGYRGTATAGEGGTATAGDRGTATAGEGGTATAGYRGTATAGDRGTATAGDRGTATAGDRGTATAGEGGTATAGEDGVISVMCWDSAAQKYRRAIGIIGENGLKPGVPYRLDSRGQWVEVMKID